MMHPAYRCGQSHPAIVAGAGTDADTGPEAARPRWSMAATKASKFRGTSLKGAKWHTLCGHQLTPKRELGTLEGECTAGRTGLPAPPILTMKNPLNQQPFSF